MKRADLLLAIPLTLGLAACGGDDHTSEEKLIDSVSDSVPAAERPSDEEIIEVAQQTCDLFEETSVSEVISSLEASYPGMVDAGGGAIMQASADVMCPEYSDEVSELLK
ncbi:DUF732 domain-containing protein [Actinomycetaceae bacterium L2_0104]